MTNSIYSQLTVLVIVLSCLAISYCQTNSFNRKINSNKYKQHQQPSTTNANESDDDVVIHPIRNKNIPTYSCHNKEDDGYYEHEESCHKYWHCLYVDTIFERAFERKCPVGTMFHPVERTCEISTMLTCSGWKKSIYGKNYLDLKIPPPPPLPQPPLPPSGEIIQEFQVDDYEAFLQFKNSLKNSSKKPPSSTFVSKSVSSKAYHLTSTTTAKSMYSHEYSSQEEEYPNLLDTTTVPSTTTKKLQKKFSLPVNKKVSPATLASATTTTTTSLAKLVNKKFKLFKTSPSSTTSASTVSVTTPAPTHTVTTLVVSSLEEKISEKLNFLSSNKLNRTQIFDEINEIKSLFEEYNTAQSTTLQSTIVAVSPFSTLTTYTTSSSSTTSQPSTMTSSTSSTLKTTTRDEQLQQINNIGINDQDYKADDNDYEYELSKSMQKNQRQFMPILFIASTTTPLAIRPLKSKQPNILTDYSYEDSSGDNRVNSNLNKKSKEKFSQSMAAKTQAKLDNHSLKASELIAENFEPLEASDSAAVASSSAAASSLTCSSWPLLLKLALLLIIIIF